MEVRCCGRLGPLAKESAPKPRAVVEDNCDGEDRLQAGSDWGKNRTEEQMTLLELGHRHMGQVASVE